MMGARSKINAISLNVKTNKRKLVHICGYKLPINVQNFTQKDSAQAKISLKVVGGYFFDSPCISDKPLVVPIFYLILLAIYFLFITCIWLFTFFCLASHVISNYGGCLTPWTKRPTSSWSPEQLMGSIVLYGCFVTVKQFTLLPV